MLIFFDSAHSKGQHLHDYTTEKEDDPLGRQRKRQDIQMDSWIETDYDQIMI